MKSAHFSDDYLYCADHTIKLVKEQWVDTIHHDGEWVEPNDKCNPEEIWAVSFYPRQEHVEPLEWKAPENRLKPSISEPPKLELKELPEHLDTFDHCLANLEKMLERCEEINLVLNWEKCHFIVKEGIVLDHKVLGSRIEVDNAKIESISKLPHPMNIKAIRIFLGHAAFDKLKQELTQAPIMIKPDWSLPFEIMCDASDYAVVLGQRREKHFQPIHYSSKIMNEAQENYTTTEKELLAVTDHSALRYLFTKQDAKPRLIRWILLVQEFYIKIHDKRGAENITANHLCRLENSELGKLTKGEIRDLFPEEQLMSITNDVL
ncbi:reverse transcriptase domain-containing protein [Tanacetum coccineum]